MSAAASLAATPIGWEALGPERYAVDLGAPSFRAPPIDWSEIAPERYVVDLVALPVRARESADEGEAGEEEEEARPVPNFLSDRPPPQPWLDVERALVRFFRINPDGTTEDGRFDRREMFAEVLARLHEGCVSDRPIRDDVVSYAIGIARNVLRDALEERRRCGDAFREMMRSHRVRGTRKRKTSSADEERSENESGACIDTRAVEDATIDCVDGRRGRRPLTAPFDRAELWLRVHDWCAARCRERFRRVLSFANVTLASLAAREVDGRALTPEEATWIRLLGTRSCPSTLELWSDTTPEEVYRKAYEATKKAIQRSAPRNRPRISKCPVKRARKSDSMYGRAERLLHHA